MEQHCYAIKSLIARYSYAIEPACTRPREQLANTRFCIPSDILFSYFLFPLLLNGSFFPFFLFIFQDIYELPPFLLRNYEFCDLISVKIYCGIFFYFHKRDSNSKILNDRNKNHIR